MERSVFAEVLQQIRCNTLTLEQVETQKAMKCCSNETLPLPMTCVEMVGCREEVQTSWSTERPHSRHVRRIVDIGHHASRVDPCS